MCRREHLFFPIWEFAISLCGLWKGPSFSTSNRMRESFMGRAIGQTQLLPARERLFPRETLAVCLLKGSVGGFFSVKVIGIEFTIFPGYPLSVRIPSPDVIFLALGIYSSLLLFSSLIWLWAEMVSKPSAATSLIASLFFCSLGQIPLSLFPDFCLTPAEFFRLHVLL